MAEPSIAEQRFRITESLYQNAKESFYSNFVYILLKKFCDICNESG